jgi:hypothetical protein
LRERGNLVRLSKTCINGLTVDVGSRKEHSLLFLFAAPGKSKEPGNSMGEGVRSMGSKQAKKKLPRNRENEKTNLMAEEGIAAAASAALCGLVYHLRRTVRSHSFNECRRSLREQNLSTSLLATLSSKVYIP